MSKRKPILRIRDHRGTYYVGGRDLPRFGGTFDDAMLFEDGMAAYHTINSFPLMVLADLVNEDEVKCDVTGKALKGAKDGQRG